MTVQGKEGKGTGTICSEDYAKLSQSPTVFRMKKPGFYIAEAGQFVV